MEARPPDDSEDRERRAEERERRAEDARSTPADDREDRERRAEQLRRRIQGLVGGEPGERPPRPDRTPPGSPHEFIEERMREEAERLRREREADGLVEDNGDEDER
jgi:hypothetical protein